MNVRRKPTLKLDVEPQAPRCPPPASRPQSPTSQPSTPTQSQAVQAITPAQTDVSPSRNLAEATVPRSSKPFTSEAELAECLARDPNDPRIHIFNQELQTRTRQGNRLARNVMLEMFAEAAQLRKKLSAHQVKKSDQWLLVPLCIFAGWVFWQQPMLIAVCALAIFFLHEHFPSIKLSIAQQAVATMACGFVLGAGLGSGVVSWAWDMSYNLVLKMFVFGHG